MHRVEGYSVKQSVACFLLGLASLIVAPGCYSQTGVDVAEDSIDAKADNLEDSIDEWADNLGKSPETRGGTGEESLEGEGEGLENKADRLEEMLEKRFD
jgi:hypothetical protein